MADPSLAEKTEEPTPRRLEQARRKGQIAISRDLNSGIAVAAACVALVVVGPSWAGGLVANMRMVLSESASATSNSSAVESCLKAWMMALVVPLGAVFGAVVLVGLVQTRGRIVLEPLRVDLNRILPSRGRLMGRDTLAEVGKGLLKIAVVCWVGYSSIRDWAHEIARLGGAGATRVLSAIGIMGKVLGFRLAVAVLAIACADYGWQIHRHRKALRMSRDELRREHKESEGDPVHKAERQRLYGEVLQQHAMAEVERADLVVVDSGALAVAIRYDCEGQGAPVVMVKGERLLAQRIEAIAGAAGVPIIGDVTLARVLMDVTEGDQIPDVLYEDVAELLVRVAQKNSQGSGQ